MQKTGANPIAKKADNGSARMHCKECGKGRFCPGSYPARRSFLGGARSGHVRHDLSALGDGFEPVEKGFAVACRAWSANGAARAAPAPGLDGEAVGRLPLGTQRGCVGAKLNQRAGRGGRGVSAREEKWGEAIESWLIDGGSARSKEAADISCVGGRGGCGRLHGRRSIAVDLAWIRPGVEQNPGTLDGAGEGGRVQRGLEIAAMPVNVEVKGGVGGKDRRDSDGVAVRGEASERVGHRRSLGINFFVVERGVGLEAMAHIVEPLLVPVLGGGRAGPAG